MSRLKNLLRRPVLIVSLLIPLVGLILWWTAYRHAIFVRYNTPTNSYQLTMLDAGWACSDISIPLPGAHWNCGIVPAVPQMRGLAMPTASAALPGPERIVVIQNVVQSFGPLRRLTGVAFDHAVVGSDPLMASVHHRLSFPFVRATPDAVSSEKTRETYSLALRHPPNPTTSPFELPESSSMTLSPPLRKPPTDPASGLGIGNSFIKGSNRSNLSISAVTSFSRGSYPLVNYFIPQWLILAIMLLPLGGWLIVRAGFAGLRVARRRRGLCAACGYDLRASPGGRCPECGALPACLT